MSTRPRITNLFHTSLVSARLALAWVSGNYKSRRFLIAIGILALILIGGIISHRLLNPPILVSPDIHPFKSVAEYNHFVENNPLITTKVPKDKVFTKTARIREDKSVVYIVELSQKPIKPQMDMAYVESYLDYLQNSQDQAKAWIRSLGQDPDRLSIIWRPNPEEMRGKMLGDSSKGIPQKNLDSTPTPTLTPTPTENATPRFPQ